MKTGIILALVSALTLGVMCHEGDSLRQKRFYPSRCYPGSHCYPDQEEIALFEDTLTGQVIVPSDGSYPASARMTNARWTRSPGIIVIAATVTDVQRTVLFARKFHLNLVYYTSGLDYQGRASYDGSLKLDLSQLKSISTSSLTNFNFAGTVSAQAGSTWGDIYGAVEASGFTRAIAGGSSSLESVATFTLTGGLGYLSRTLGLAADNLLSATVVLADGRLATVSDGVVTVTDAEGAITTYDDSDLMKALRGGGLTYAIPVSFTYNLAIAPGQYASLTAQYTMYDDNNPIGSSFLRRILQQLVNLPVQWGGYLSVDGAASTQFANERGTIKYHLFSYGQYIFNNLQSTTIENLRNIIQTTGLNPTTSTLSSLSQYRNDVAEAEQHFTSKSNSYVFNTLINSDVITNSDRLEGFINLLMDVANAPTVQSTYRCVARLAGGKVSNPNFNNVVNPKLREAFMSVTCALTWEDGLTREDYYIAQAMAFQSRLRAFGNGGIDPYYSSEDVEDWRQALYGDNYRDLVEIKKEWDVDNYLWSHNAVASDFELNCNGIRCPHRH